MGDMIWLGSVLAMAVFGYYVMLRLGTFLEKMQKEDEAQAKTEQLHMAASEPERKAAEKHPGMQSRLLDSNPVPFTLGNPKKVIRPAGTCVRHRKAVWNTGTSASFPSDLFE